MDNEAYINQLLANAREAQKVLETYGQKKVNEIAKAIARVVFDEADPLAKMAAEETRMGVYEDKIKKNQGKAKLVWYDLKDRKSVGIFRYIEDEGIVEVAKPMGVVGAVTPCTNPIVTPMCNAMFAIKGRNSIIIAPHPRAKKCAKHMEGLFHAAFEEMGVPKNIFQVIAEPSLELTNLLMKSADVVVATGGMGMVKAAYSSGKPSYGVGAGNVQCIIDKGYSLSESVPKIIAGRIFDNGIICTGEQTAISHEDDFDAMIKEFEKNGARIVKEDKELDKLREVLYPDGVINKEAVGQPVYKIAEIAGIDIPDGTKVIVVVPKEYGAAEYFAKEKMFPVLAAYKYKTWEEAVNIALANLEVEGKGHSASIHSENKANVEYAMSVLPVSRIVVNQISSTMTGGSFLNGLAATTTLGCGSWGNNSISENLTYKHLINVSRIAYVKPNAGNLTDEEIWDD